MKKRGGFEIKNWVAVLPRQGHTEVHGKGQHASQSLDFLISKDHRSISYEEGKERKVLVGGGEVVHIDGLARAVSSS